LPLQDPHTLNDKDYLATAEISAIQQEMELFGMDWYDPTCYATEILDAKYEKFHIDDIVSQLKHLNDQLQTDIKQVLSKFTKLFDGTLGVYPHRKFHVDLNPGAKPKHA
jgi:hypothetical protein